MLKKIIFLFTCVLLMLNVCAKSTSALPTNAELTNNQLHGLQIQLDATNKDFEFVKREVDLLNKQTNSQNSITDSSFNRISNQIDAASHNQNLAMGLFVLLAIILGLYVTFVEQSVKRLKSDNEQIKEETLKIKDETQSINDNINHNFKVVYKKIKEEETIDLLNRLVKIPEDIQNLHPLLTTRELHSDEHLDLIKKAFENVKKIQNTYTDDLRLSFSSLVLQHFSNRLFSDEFCTESINDFPSISQNFFNSEIFKLCDDFFTTVALKEFSAYESYFRSIVQGILNRQISDSSSLHPDLNYLFSKFLSNSSLVDEMFNIEIETHVQKFKIFCDEFKAINNINLIQFKPRRAQ